MRWLVVVLALSGCCVKCGDGDVHGDRARTADGGSELTAGPFDWKCAARIDGVARPQGVPVPVTPGLHTVECDAESMTVDVPPGRSVTVDYFGP